MMYSPFTNNKTRSFNWNPTNNPQTDTLFTLTNDSLVTVISVSGGTPAVGTDIFIYSNDIGRTYALTVLADIDILNVVSESRTIFVKAGDEIRAIANGAGGPFTIGIQFLEID